MSDLIRKENIVKLLKKIVSLVVIAGVLGSCLLITPTNAEKITNATIEAYEQQLAENKKKQEQYLAELDNLKDKQAKAFEQKAAIDKAIEANLVQKNLIESLIAELEAEIKELDQKEIEIKNEMEKRKQIFLKRMAAMQEEGNASYLDLVLSATDITDFLSRLDYVNSMLEYDQKLIEELERSQELLDTTRAEKKTVLATQNAAIAELDLELEKFDKLRAEQQANLDAIEADVDYKQTLVNEASKLDKELDEQLTQYLAEEKLSQEAAAQAEKNNQANSGDQNPTPKPPVATGKFMWPLTTGYISSHFGYRNLNGRQDYHAATDIAASTGTPIYASASGTVLRSEWHDSYGYYVLINHGLDENGNQITTLYAHMSVKFAVAGKTVNQGDIIGQVGNTGYSFGSHLHFEYRINGERVDPENYVPR